jgi:hypothetical protein
MPHHPAFADADFGLRFWNHVGRLARRLCVCPRDKLAALPHNAYHPWLFAVDELDAAPQTMPSLSGCVALVYK